MNDPIQANGDEISKLVIVLDSNGALHVNHPPTRQ